MNSKAYLTLTKERNEIEEALNVLNNEISEIRDEAKKLKKGSEERKALMDKIEFIKNDDLYKTLKAKLETFNFCINTVFYL